MMKRLVFALSLVLLAPTPACREPSPDPAASHPSPPSSPVTTHDVVSGSLAPVGEVDGEPIGRDAFVEWMMATQGPLAFDEYAMGRVVMARAAAAKIAVSDEAVAELAERKLARWVAQEPTIGSVSRIDDVYGADGAQALRARMQGRARLELLARALLAHERANDESVLRAEFERLYGKDGVRPRVSHIFFATDAALATDYTPQQHAEEEAAIRERLRARSEALRAEAVAGRPLAEIAREHGDDRGGQGDGELGTRWRGTWGPEIDAAVEALAASGGGISPVIETGRGFHVIEVYGVEKAYALELSVLRVAAEASDGRPPAVAQREAEARAREAAEVARREGFAHAVRRYSTDPRTAARDGAFGEPVRFGSFGPQVESVLRGLEDGVVSEPVLVGREWWVMRIESRARVPEEDVPKVRQLFMSWLYPAEKARRMGAGRAEASARERAQAALARLEAGESFAEVAREVSEDAQTREAGGLLAQWREGLFGEAVDAALRSLSPGERTGVVESSAGLHVFQLEVGERVAYEAVRESLRESIARRGVSDGEVAGYLRRLRAEAGVRWQP